MGLPTKRGKSGAARAFISRRKAMLKLNLSLKEFRRLCILKGVYPVEPRKKSKLDPGNKMKTYYLLSDIQYLSHEPIIWKFWEFKIFMRRMKKAKAFKDGPRIESLVENKPFYKLDHVVRERYPTFIDAIRDLDDGLSMCLLYSRFSKSLNFPQDLIEMSRRLTAEFMHWIIDARTLRKVFVSIKGYYYQAEVMGQTVTWISPHPFVVPKLADVDAKVIRTFTEFYVYLLGFVNFRLYKQSNLLYPPRVSMDQVNQSSIEALDEESLKKELVYGLNRPLVKEGKEQEEEEKMDAFDENEESEESEVKSAFGLTYRQTVKLQSLFDGCRFFLNREVPQEPLTFMVRAFGGQVSWHSTQHPGATYDESDDRITHHIVDKEVPNRRFDRVYLQPQWIFDSINARQLLNCQEYFPGVQLPPHLSPFVEEESSELHYVTPDVARLKGQAVKPIQVSKEAAEAVKKSGQANKRKNKSPAHGSGEKKSKSITQSKVVTGQPVKLDARSETKQVEKEEKKLAVMMIPKKQKKLYDKIVKVKKDKARKVAKLTAKRVHWEDEERKRDTRA